MTGAAAFYVTTPIYYVNDKPHIGHAYTTLACDVMARFKRLDGFDVHFLTGTDEHGQKVEKSAETAGITPQALADINSANFRELARRLGCSNDDFIRTTEERHHLACQALWNELIRRDEIYLGHYEGWYSVRDEAFYGEDELVSGPGGTRLAPTGAPVEWVKEPSYFFRLSKWQQKLLDWYEANPDAVAPASRLNEVRSFVAGGLQDLSVSRTSFKWGIPVPGDENHIMYVWLDALTNYMTAVGYPDMKGDFARFWPEVIHVVGKDIVRFHAVYWPALLMAAELPPPRRIFAHGWWTNEGQKISKSVGNVIDPLGLIDTYGLDQLRFFLLREVPFGNDGDFSHRAMIGRMNSELANDLGNLAQRVLSMIGKNCGGKVPSPQAERSEDDRVMLSSADGLLAAVRPLIDRQAFNEVLETIWVVIRAANGYVDRQAPWALRKTDPARMETVLYVLAETIRAVATLLHPFMPSSADRMLDQLAIAANSRTFAFLGEAGRLVPGTALPTPQGVFPRFVEETAD
ncbi:methionine--tRNA ligase [Magnetospirillum molischianum]|uniref:Methionine--tRNA ligase n=1 Tax=Magnetospirillum molischianum DSM 120 TaxID=1150626 RepID=H8FXR1_MAGML|nr:methionine--tRNA ligase [Magnetospirillum molischianum]CCG43149.1 Methionyl-tRNA synthetase [Magnetospirillum molischianum DSM 120]